jgi:hypothetical protein
MLNNKLFAALVISSILLSACLSSAPQAELPIQQDQMTVATKPVVQQEQPSPAITESTDHHSEVDITHLPLGDGNISASPQVGYVYSCETQFNGGGAFVAGDWMNGDGTWDLTKKPTVDGSVTWPASFTIALSGDERIFQSNDYPDHPTGTYPIAASDDAYNYDRNPNSIEEQTLEFTLPANPKLAETPTCVSMGAIGIMTSGVVLFNALDAGGKDAVANEIQDNCGGHPERTGEYHYHNLSTCISDDGTGQSGLVGYALDGFGIYGPRDANGNTLTSADLDECHGITSEVDWDGARVVMYHYVATAEYPYTVGCFRGTPVTITGQQSQDGANATQQGLGGANGGQGPDIAAAAATLGVTEDAIRAALGPPRQGRPDFASAAQTLGVTEAELMSALGIAGGGPPPSTP